MDPVTENLLRDLASSPTDLKRLVIRALWRKDTPVAIEAKAISRWERDDPKRWASVQDWLLSQGITITVLTSRSAMTDDQAQSPPPEPPAADLHVGHRPPRPVGPPEAPMTPIRLQQPP